MVLRQKSIDALNLYGQLLLDNDISIMIVLFITILQNLENSIKVCHDRFMKFKTNLYDTKSDEIHLGLGVM